MTSFFHNHIIILVLILSLVCAGLMTRIMRNPKLGLYLTFFATGILLSPNLPVVREKLSGAEFLMMITWFAILVRRKKSEPSTIFTKNQTRAVVWGGVFVGWIVFSFFWNSFFNSEVYKTHSVASIVETCNFIYGYLMFLTVVFMVKDWETWKNCVVGWLWGAVVVSFVGVLAFAGHAPAWAYDSFSHRICSTLRTENQVPSFLMPIFVLLVFMTVERGTKIKFRLVRLVLLGGVFLTSLGTGGRTCFLMMILSVFLVLYVARKEWRFHAFNWMRLVKMFMVLFFSMIFYVYFALTNFNGDYSLGTTPAWQRPVAMMYEWIEGHRVLDVNREHELAVVSENIGDNLVVGTGPKNYGSIYGVEEIHNTYAGMLFQTGIPGLVLLLLWLGSSLWAGWRAGKKLVIPQQRLYVMCMLAGMILILFYGLTIFGLRQRNIWLLAGLLVAAESLVPRRWRPSIFQRRENPIMISGDGASVLPISDSSGKS
ncbi:MAG: hypothetical protein ACREL1_04485 [bacterium]